jgi:hypothetical protein
MRQITRRQLNDLLAEHESPCVSLYQPTHRQHPENQQDPIRFGNLLRRMRDSLEQAHSVRLSRALADGLQPLVEDEAFWNHRTEGLAAFSAPGVLHVFDLQRPVEELLVVADRFHVKPLLRILQSADRYQVLCIDLEKARLLEGNRYALDPIELTQFPATLTEALGEELTEPHQTVASYGDGSGAPLAPHGEPAMYHGHGGRKDEVEIDMVRFFRVVDRGIWEHHSRPSGLPLMLAALDEHHAPFHEVSHNPQLLANGITTNPDALDLDQLREEAWRAFMPHYSRRLEGLEENFRLASSRQLGADDLQQAASAAVEGRVATLLVEADRQIAGRMDRSTGEIRLGELNDLQMGDLLDELAISVLQRDGHVVVVPGDRMPTDTGLAATYRYRD